MAEPAKPYDEKLWNQCLRLFAKGRKKPEILPNRVGALMGLEEEPGEATVVSLVDGNQVKIKYDMNFSETTHEEREPSYCTGIWVDANVPSRDWPFLLYRSAHEYRDMCQDEMSYEVARSRAQKDERELRLNDWNDQGKSV